MATPDGHRREQRQPAWVRLAVAPVPVLLPLLVPVLLLVVVLGFYAVRDTSPSALEPASGLVPGASAMTGWQLDDSLLPSSFGPGDPAHASPQALANAIVARTTQVGDPEPWIGGTIVDEDSDTADARIFLPLPELGDAYVAAEFFLELTRASDGWRIDDTHVRLHCRREVRDSLCGL